MELEILVTVAGLYLCCMALVTTYLHVRNSRTGSCGDKITGAKRNVWVLLAPLTLIGIVMFYIITFAVEMYDKFADFADGL